MDVTTQEPRLKGSFKVIHSIYKEMFFVLHQILDRFDTIKFLRQQYGSAVAQGEVNVCIFSFGECGTNAGSLMFSNIVEKSMRE